MNRSDEHSKAAPVAHTAWLKALREHPRKPSPALFLVLTQLALRLDWKTGSGYASEEKLAADAGVSRSAVTRALRWAQAEGLLKQTRRGHRLGDGRTIASEWALVTPPADSQCVIGDALTRSSMRQTEALNASIEPSQCVTSDAPSIPKEHLAKDKHHSEGADDWLAPPDEVQAQAPPDEVQAQAPQDCPWPEISLSPRRVPLPGKIQPPASKPRAALDFFSAPPPPDSGRRSAREIALGAQARREWRQEAAQRRAELQSRARPADSEAEWNAKLDALLAEAEAAQAKAVIAEDGVSAPVGDTMTTAREVTHDAGSASAGGAPALG